jgi:hypothetical protein
MSVKIVIVEKIKKLLRLAQSPHPAEAELALRRAFEIAAKYQVDIELLDLGEDVKRLICQAHRVGMRLTMQRRLALCLVASFFNVDPVIQYPHVHFVGTAADIAIAVHVVEYLVRCCTDELARHNRFFWGGKMSANRRANFIHGFFYGVTSRLSATRDAIAAAPQVGIILADAGARRERFASEAFPNLAKSKPRQPRRRDRNALLHGYTRGREISIDPALTTPKPKALS